MRGALPHRLTSRSCPCAEDAFAFIGTLVGIAGGVSQSAFDNWPVVPQKLLGASREPLDIALGFGLAAGKVLFGPST